MCQTRRIAKIHCNFPVGKNFSNCARDEWPLPLRAEIGTACRDGMALIIKQSDDNIAGETRFNACQRSQLLEEAAEINLCAEHRPAVALGPAPEHEIQFVLQESSKG